MDIRSTRHVDDLGHRGGWCILQTSGARTMPLKRSLADAGFAVWTPSKTIRRPAPGQGRRLVMGQRRRLIDVEVAILPGMLFAPAGDLMALADMAASEARAVLVFSIFQFGGRVPIISEASLSGLRDAEAAEAARLAAERDAETREEARRARAERIRGERARTKALRRMRRTFDIGQEVAVEGAPALAGLTGRVLASSGATARIDFGGSLQMEVEAWRVIPSPLYEGDPIQGMAA